MNHKPQTSPVFSWSASLLAVIASGSLLLPFAAAAFADEKASQADPASATPAPAPTQESPAATEPAAAASQEEQTPAAENLPKADEILTQVRTKLEGLDSLKCELNQIAMVAGMKLQASGKYVEASGNRVRLQFVMAPMVSAKAEDDKSLALDAESPALEGKDDRAQLLQVSDGSVMYTTWKNGKDVRVTRRNIRDILTAASSVATYDPKNAAMDLGVGGLRGLISRLQTTMEFGPVKSVKAGERNLYEVTGRWSEKVRKEVFQIPEGSLVDPRPHVPEYCRVYVDVETMLPRRIQFLKRNVETNPKLVRPMLSLDLRNIALNETVEDQLFAFTPPEGVKEEDLTQEVIDMIQKSTQPPESPDAAKSAPKEAPK